jgi:hypothetical protein
MVRLPAYLLGKQGVRDAMFLPEITFFNSCSYIQHFNRKSTIGLKFPRKFLP